MPELPETETIARDLHALVRGAMIVDTTVVRGDVLRGTTAAALPAQVQGRAIAAVWRRAKLVVLDLSDGARLVVQPRFTGALLLDTPAAPLPARDAAYVTVTFALGDGRRLHYRDIRRLGTLAHWPAERFAALVATLGPEPLDAALTAERFSDSLRGSRQAIKKVLMDQRVLAGVGNIYATEACWAAGVDPSRAARSLDGGEAAALLAALRDVLTRSIAARGTSFRDYVDARGERGGFVPQLQAYGRGGEPCARCGSALVDTAAIDGRTTVFCWRCQR